MGPANMPKPVVDRLHKEIVAIVATPEFKAAMDANGAEPIASKSPDEFRDMLREQVDQVREDHQGARHQARLTRASHGNTFG